MKLVSILLTIAEALKGTFVHLTDIHYDPNYKAGSPVHCLSGKLFGLACCRSYNIPIEPHVKANKWGDLSCDTPFLFVNKTFEWIRLNIPDIDFIVYTGDSVGHHDVTQSVTHNIRVINDIDGLFQNYFGNLKVYSSIGNHDTYPIDQTYSKFNTIFLKNFANNWGRWLNNSETILKGGYYVTQITERLYVVNINSLLYDNINLFHLDIAIEQWLWFETTLEYIRNTGGSIWIVNHICPWSGEASTNYTSRFVETISRYSDIIKYQFYGHVHQDTFTLLSDSNRDIVGFCSVPSSVMLDKHESSFRVYKYDTETFDILDYDHYVSDLNATISRDEIVYHHSYSFNAEYDLDGVNLNNWIRLYDKIKNNNTILQKYYHNFNPGLKHNDCDADCKQKILSNILPI